jgi:predicted cobalt transporter CbtA
VSYADTWEKTPRHREQAVQKAKGACARVFEEEEAGCDGWSRRSDREVARYVGSVGFCLLNCKMRCLN